MPRVELHHHCARGSFRTDEPAHQAERNRRARAGQIREGEVEREIRRKTMNENAIEQVAEDYRKNLRRFFAGIKLRAASARELDVMLAVAQAALDRCYTLKSPAREEMFVREVLKAWYGRSGIAA
jgi:hypothetical protein